MTQSFSAAADSMLTTAIYEMTGILPTDPGYGYYRDHVQMFDPGWKGYQTKGPEDWNFDVFDKGNDPEGVLQRYIAALSSCSQLQWCSIMPRRLNYCPSAGKHNLAQRSKMHDFAGICSSSHVLSVLPICIEPDDITICAHDADLHQPS